MTPRLACPPGGTLFRRGRNCWAVKQARSVTVLIDAADYFRALMRSILAAERTVFIIGWDFHSRTRLLAPGETLPEDPAAPAELGAFLNYATQRRQDLRIRILVWDFPALYDTDREFGRFYGLRFANSWTPNRRIRQRYDNSHALGGSHHQKLVVVDDDIAFCGGIDLARDRWDRPAHAPNEPGRRIDGEAYGPTHDVMMQVEGAAARALGRLVRKRWRHAGGQLLHTPKLADLAIDGMRAVRKLQPSKRPNKPKIRDGLRIGISRTYAREVLALRGAREVEQLYLDQVRAAKRCIVIENQYFTCRSVGDALVTRLAEPEGPELIVIVRLLSHGWLEELTMERLRTQLIARLRSVAGEDRVRIYYPHIDGLAEGVCIDVHSKLAIFDDDWLRIGSANFANRSMGLDSECDLTLEAKGNPRARAIIAHTRNRLFAEHLGCSVEEVEQAMAAHKSTIAAIESLRRPGPRGLRDLRPTDTEEAPVLLARLGDPESPVTIGDLARLIAQETVTPVDAVQGGRRVWPAVVIASSITLGLSLGWRYTPAAHWINAERIVEWAAAVGNPGIATVVLMLFAHTAASLLLFPRPLITLFAVTVFGAWLGFALSLCGLLVAAFVTYAVGQQFGAPRVAQLGGRQLHSLVRTLRHRSFAIIALTRLVPLVPYALEGAAAGALRLGLGDYLLGTLVGMLPGTLLATVLVSQVRQWFGEPGPAHYVAVTAMLIILGTGIWGLRRRLVRTLAPSSPPG